MRYAKALFDLQLQFAEAVTRISGTPLSRALFEYTNLFIRFGAGRDFDPAHPIWQEYLAGLEDAGDRSEWTYRFYLQRPESMARPVVIASVGCFSCARLSADQIRLHFENVEPVEHSPLAKDRVDRRRAELAGLFAHVKRTTTEPRSMVGASWLYNLDAYRRLFPPTYVATARPHPGRFRHMPRWGQFVDRHRQVRESMTRPFLERLSRQSTMDDLEQCFPLRILRVEAPVSDFYEFYGV